MPLRLRVLLAGFLVVLGAACGKSERPATGGAPGNATAGTAGSGTVDPQAVTLVVAYGSEKKVWFEEAARAFEASDARTKSGRAIRVSGKAMGSGEAMRAIVSGDLKAHVFSPASSVYVTLLNQAWQSTGGHTKALAPAGEPLVLSPIVIAMWKPMAQALGWPEKRIAWRDLLKINTDPAGWGALGHPEWGRFKLGHTHPDFSNSGVLAVLAEAYAGANKTRGLTSADVAAPETAAFVQSIEETIVHYGKSTGFFADKMLERGPAYLSAAVLYENLVIDSYREPHPGAPFPIVAIYPVEGTFWSDHPYAILDADWVGPDERSAAEAFQAFLRAKPQQERAMALGFRPGDPSIAMGAPIDAEHGVDPKQPSTLLETPSADILAQLLALWQKTKKPTDVVLVFDKSGSMQGEPLRNAQAGAKAFLDTLHDNDQVTLLFFDSSPYPPFGPFRLGDKKAEFIQRIDEVYASGQTALYDAVALAQQAAQARVATEPNRIHAVVVMTDGLDQGSAQTTLEGLKSVLSNEEQPVRVFTISYGDQADKRILGAIAEAAKGATAAGDVKNIVAVFQDMGSFF